MDESYSESNSSDLDFVKKKKKRCVKRKFKKRRKISSMKTSINDNYKHSSPNQTEHSYCSKENKSSGEFNTEKISMNQEEEKIESEQQLMNFECQNQEMGGGITVEGAFEDISQDLDIDGAVTVQEGFQEERACQDELQCNYYTELDQDLDIAEEIIIDCVEKTE